MDETLMWIIVAVVALLIIAAILGVVASRKKKDHDYGKAGELRQQAAAKATGLQQQEAQAREADARARAAQAEADRKAAEADRLQAEASQHKSATDSHRQEHDDTLRKADELDPTVDHKSGETGGYGTPEEVGYTGSDTGEPHGPDATHDHGEHRDTVTYDQAHPDASDTHVDGHDTDDRPGSTGGAHRP